MKYTTIQTATMFDISRETVRLWTEEFAEHLSPTATPQQGRHRKFTDEDMSVFALIHRMKGEGSIYEDIHLALQRGDREPPPNSLELALPENISQKLALMQTQILAIQEDRNKAIRERDEAIAHLRVKEESEIRLKALLERSEEQLAASNDRLEKLLREIGKLEAKLDT